MEPSPVDVFDLDSLTVEEVEILEEVTGVSMDEAFAPGRPKGRALRALAYISGRRADPEFTLEDAGKVRLALSGEAGRLDPPDPAGS